ncbi:MAG: IS66 family transposase [Leptospiraceae bacterium]|nr:IS66 family transposase [Leptospiraceae bacterium]
MFCTELYRLENEAREANFSSDALVKCRQEKCKPVMESFGNWLYERRAKSYDAHSMLDKAVNCARTREKIRELMSFHLPP